MRPYSLLKQSIAKNLQKVALFQFDYGVQCGKRFIFRALVALVVM